jgi:hypothetical protein
MTDAQEELIWGAPRDAEGKLIPPRPPKPELTLEEELQQAAAALASLGATPEQQEEAFAIIRKARQ